MSTLELTYTLDEIDTVAKTILDHLYSKIVRFNGAMGVGKTALIKALLKVLKTEDRVTSPTFSIVNEYSIPNDKAYHFDFYRINSIEEAYNFGIEDYFNSECWIFMEWAERVEALLPEEYQTIDIAVVDDKTRTLKLNINKQYLTNYNAMAEPKF
ncbi:tRNA (adenosine(37)-N6)-threonylcarbamoyltransferase complex ATPase subunit type 1 TsaE [uncultured Winogradskyella sp.]|uniref:tRNA (adenosine(37)-N6)-threonylcarbamoyltransferase complex ATPase subunit type 1 TsaE n=1 Tax=uncultured Winogradskyella sp. TaxID=395353 RepID=UPI002626EEC1|nr:tRNA (adenosine(37)-N6)-threonylcarbamoyltransferase complex ATPase subunit type 1 TsaE [uncultured Winogradskyella sp.]